MSHVLSTVSTVSRNEKVSLIAATRILAPENVLGRIPETETFVLFILESIFKRVGKGKRSLNDDICVVVLPFTPAAEAEDAACRSFSQKRRHCLVLPNRVERIGKLRRVAEVAGTKRNVAFAARLPPVPP